MKLQNLILKNRIVSKIRKNITWKLFLVTALVFTLFITSTLLFQSVFFGKFYIAQKKRHLENKIQKFALEYNKSKDENSIIDLMKNFEEDNNSKIVIMGQNEKIKFITNSYDKGYDAIRVKIINDIIMEWSSSSNILSTMKQNNKTITIITDTRINGTKNILSAVPDNKKNEIIFAITSLQPVNEASAVIKEFYVYFYIGAMVIIIVLSLIYTNMVSKPLVKINSTAKKMAGLDFSEKCSINSNDEIGNLACTLNFLSDNLDSALTSLKKVNKKLEVDIEKERRLERTRKDFVNAVSHELKTPINLIEGYAEGIKDNVFESENRDYYIDIIIDESKKMGDLVADMLNLSHLESGIFKITREEFFVDKLIQPILKKFSVIIKNKNIILETKIVHNIKVYADWNMIEQVITNFLTNAIRYTNANGHIIVLISKVDEKIVVSVENSGINIPEDQIDKVWNNFYRIDKSRNRKLGGTGLGLAIVKNILTLHGYKYGIKNTNIGVKFYFEMDTIC